MTKNDYCPTCGAVLEPPGETYRQCANINCRKSYYRKANPKASKNPRSLEEWLHQRNKYYKNWQEVPNDQIQ